MPQLELTSDHVWVVNNFKKDKNYSYYDGVVTEILSLYSPGKNFRIRRRHGEKPVMAPLDGEEIFFSLSHAEDVLVLAISKDGELGVDAEYVKDRRYASRIAQRYFRAEEGPSTLECFYRSWTAREAFIKAIGSGLGKSISAIQTKNRDEEMFIGLKDDFSHRVSFYHPLANFLVAVCRKKESMKKIVLRTM